MIATAKQQSCQLYIFKIHSSRLRKNKWNLSLSLDEARRNDEVVSLASSQVLRWIAEINGVSDADDRARQIKEEIKRVKSDKNNIKNRNIVKKLYKELDNLQFQKDYMCLMIDRTKDYHRACEGFSINGVRYHRLLGTNGGIKNSTIVFVSDMVVDELRKRITNGRDLSVPLVTAKLEAYQALACSASIPVSFPKGFAVVNDCETRFYSDYIYLTDEGDGEPVMELRRNQEIVMDASDGFGLMLPSLAERWSGELGLDYMMSGCNTRFSFEKGCAFTFDYLDFAEKIAGGNYIIKDAWGNDVDLRETELILTTSMCKLWDSYESCAAYLENSIKNHYTFGITKTCPKELESERHTNYQFIQPLPLTDEDIEELIAPTMNEFKEVLGGDWRKAVLFLKGCGLSDRSVSRIDNDYIKAMMIDQRIADDPFVQSSIYQMIKNRIDEAKVGVLKVHGNYSICSGDPYSLCQSMFGLEVTGLLKPDEIYNRYWLDAGAEKLACFRAPMTCANNIRLVYPSKSEEVKYWYRYMNTCTVLNSWDLITAALNGCDYDGDIVMLTDNRVIVEKMLMLPALMCAQRKAEKRISSEQDFIQSNIDSFGNEIGQTTNWATSMYEVRSHFKPGSKEYETLSYRICSGQLYQQNAIDKAKGIICKPMPRTWHDRYSILQSDIDDKDFYLSIVVDRKPYFMRYVYPSLNREYREYVKTATQNSVREFGLTLGELFQIPAGKLTERQAEFIKFYNMMMPVGTGNCVMNKICRRFEEEFDGFVGKYSSDSNFNYEFMKSGAEYTRRQYNAMSKLYDDYNKDVQDLVLFAKRDRVDKYDMSQKMKVLNDEYNNRRDEICTDSKVICDLILDICYKHSSSKKLAWSLCGRDIIDNLLAKNNRIIRYPTRCDDGEVEYCGERFTIAETYLEDNTYDYFEGTRMGGGSNQAEAGWEETV